MPNNVPIVAPQVSACKRPQGTSAIHLDKYMQDLYHKLKNMKGKEIDFEKKKKYKPFIPVNSKYANVLDHKTYWHCGMSRHIRPLCP